MIKESTRIPACAAAVALSMVLGMGPIHAAPGDHAWSSGYAAWGLASVDGLGNVASAGIFQSAVSFGGATLTPLNSTGDVYLTRHDTNGSHLWSRQFTPDGLVTLDKIATDEAGNIFIAGKLFAAEGSGGNTGTIDFGGGDISGNGELYLAGFDASGTHLFSFVAGSAQAQDLAAGGGYVAVTGYTYATPDFGGGPIGGAGGADIFLASLTTSGAHAWSASYGNATGQGGMAVTVDGSGQVILAATTDSGIDFGGGVLTPTTAIGLCLVKFTETGAHTWSQLFDGKFSNGVGILVTLSVDVSPTGRIVLGGQMNDPCDFGGGTLTSNGSGDVFLAMFDGQGAHQWSANYGGSITDYVKGVAFTASEDVFVAGLFYSANCSFGGGSFTPGGASADFFAALYTTTGAHVWSERFGGTGQYDIHADTDPAGPLFLSGGAAAGIDFGGGPLADAVLFHVELVGNGGGTTAVTPHPVLAHLEQNQPNPFNPSTVIRFRLAETGFANLDIYDMSGRRVTTLLSGTLPAGPHEFQWNGRDAGGRSVASGSYVYRLAVDGLVQSKRMTLLK